MGMKRFLIAVVLMGSSGVMAEQYEYATVLDATPVYQSVNIESVERRCEPQPVVYRDDHRRERRNRVVIGSLLGGAIGHALGNDSSNKKVGLIAGAFVGGGIASATTSNRGADTSTHCYEVPVTRTEQKLMGYDVRYRYNNETFTARMDSDPGDSIMVVLSPVPRNMPAISSE